MIPLLEKLLWRSPLGQEIRQTALADAAGQEQAFLAEISRHEQVRDARLQELQQEQADLRPQLDALRAQQAQAEEEIRKLHFHVTMVLPNQEDEAHRVHNKAVIPLRDKLKELAEVKAQLQPTG